MSKRANDLFEGILLGCHAVTYMAMTLSQTVRTFEMTTARQRAEGRPDEVIEEACVRGNEALRDALVNVSNLMNDLGDYCNGVDAVEADDMRAVNHVFKRIKELLKEGA